MASTRWMWAPAGLWLGLGALTWSGAAADHPARPEAAPAAADASGAFLAAADQPRAAEATRALRSTGRTPPRVGFSPILPRGAAPWAVTVWDTDEGLPQNSVTAIVETHDGFLWLGTLNGLVRFDGTGFTVFDESNTGLRSSRIVSLFEDRQGNLWIGTQTAGVALLKDGQITSVGIGAGSSDRHLAAACQDAGGGVWLYTADGQLWRYADQRFSVFSFGLGVPSACRTLVAEAAGPVWIGMDGRLAAIRPTPAPGVLEPEVVREVPVRKLDLLLASARGGYWRLADRRIQKWQANRLERDLGVYPWGGAPVAAACEDREGNLVVGTLGAGVYWFGADGHPTVLSTAQHLSHNIILSLCLDREGSLWVGTDGAGLDRVKQQVFTALDQYRGETANVVQTVCADTRGGLWVGSNGGGVAYWRDGVPTYFGFREGLVNLYVRAVLVDRDQVVWAGTWGAGLFQLHNGRFERAVGTETLPAEVSALYQDHAGRLWVGTQGGLACREAGRWRLFTRADGLSAEEVRALAEDAQGNLWIGTVGGGLDRLRAGEFRAFHKADGLPSEDIAALLVDAQGVLWVGTFGSGLGRWADGRWTHYTTKNGLISNSIGQLVEDDRGDLWLGSNLGVMRLSQQELNNFARGLTPVVTGRAYGKQDGLPTRECSMGSQPAAARTGDGALWFPTVRGLATVRPDQLVPNAHPPPVMIDAVLLDGQPLPANPLRVVWPQPLVVPRGRERLEIHYSSLSLGAPDRSRFKYRLEGHESGWTEAGSGRVARYSRLPPGHYVFQVQACNEDGVWNTTGSVLAVWIEPPLWRTWWFLTASGLLLLGGITAAVQYLSTQRYRRQLETFRREEALQAERSRIARDIHDQLGASLTQVALLGELVEGDKEAPDQVEGHARQIQQAARDTTRVLDEIVWAVNPSNDTLEGLMTYACKYAQEYLALAGVRFRLEAPAELPAITLPPEVRHNVFLAFKEAVTNVVRHAAASAVWVRLRLQADGFTLEIEDNGRGLGGVDAAAAATRNGVRNMRRRLETVGGSFELRPAPEHGTVVRLTVLAAPAPAHPLKPGTNHPPAP